MILRFDSIADFCETTRELHDKRLTDLDHREHWTRSLERSWDLGVSGQEAAKRAVQGDTSIVPNMNASAQGFAFNFGAGEGFAFVPSVYGSRVSVPAYLAGRPDCMRRRAKREGERRIEMYVSNVATQGVPAQEMMRRGAAILGMLEALQGSGVAVDLYLMIDTSGAYTSARVKGPSRESWDMTPDGLCTMIIPIESRPLDLSASGFALAHPAFFRNIAFVLASAYGFTGKVPHNFESSGAVYGLPDGLEKYMRLTRARLGLGRNSVIVPRVSQCDPMLSRPEEWITERVKLALQVASEDPIESTPEINAF